jgi:hypothetical protein
MTAELAPPRWGEVLLHIAAFFSTTLMCHGELAKDRPSHKHLTEFYFWMSLGGVLGGLFNALISPIVFQYGIWEYPLAMAFACLLRSNLVDTPQTLIPGDTTSERTTVLGRILDFAVPIAMGLLTYGAIYAVAHYSGVSFVLTSVYLVVIVLVLALIGLGAFLYFGTGVLYIPGLDVLIRMDAETKRRGREGMAELYQQYKGLLFLFGIMILLGCGIILFKNMSFDLGQLFRRSYLLAVIVVIVLALSLRPIRFGLSVLALFVAVTAYNRSVEEYTHEARGFFGPLKVKETEYAHQLEFKRYRALIHGGIDHGRQVIDYVDPEGHTTEALRLRKRREPITYFHERNGVAEVYHKLSFPNEQPPINVTNMTGASDSRMAVAMVGLGASPDAALGMLVNTQSEPPYAVVGLGTGILACYAKPYQVVDFYEIDPLVRDMSIVKGYVPPWHEDRGKMGKLADPIFYFLQDAQERWANLSVKMGDGRLVMKNEKERERYYHVISLDAFSSDAIPVHLLTKEAVELYLSKLADGGVLVFNTTNRYVRIESPLASIARDLDLECLTCADWVDRRHDDPDRYSADWVVLRRRTDEKGYKSGGPPLAKRLLSERKLIAWNGEPYMKQGEPAEKRWVEVPPLPGPGWTDSSSNLLNPKPGWTDSSSNLLNPKVMPWLTEWRNLPNWVWYAAALVIVGGTLWMVFLLTGMKNANRKNS